MEPLTQDLIAAGLLLLAVSYLAWRGYRTIRGKKTGCGCDTCPAVKKQDRTP